MSCKICHNKDSFSAREFGLRPILSVQDTPCQIAPSPSHHTSVFHKINLTVRRISGRARTPPHDREARASGLLWFVPLGCQTSAGWPLSRPSQCAHWLALRPMRQHRPALTADGQRKIFPRRGANLFNVRCGSYSGTEPAA